jgi:hypothetical protein
VTSGTAMPILCRAAELKSSKNSSREGSKVRPKEFSIATDLDDVELPLVGKLRES